MRGDKLELNESNWRGPSIWKVPFYRRTWFSVLMVMFILVVVAAVGVFMFMVQPLREKAQIFDLEEMKTLEAASIVYDRNGGELARIYIENRKPVSIGEVPPHLIDALTAQEDSRYFQHNGVDYLGVARAFYLNFKEGEVTQGASTITQQLSRGCFDLGERGYRRKILEVFLAQRIEAHYSKTEILEMYLNRIYFGAGFHGIQSASNGYFGKDVKGLTIEESATLCGLIKSPNRLSPIKHPEESVRSRNMVLDRMREEGHLTDAEADELKLKPLITTARSNDPQRTYVFEEVRQEIVKLVGDDRAGVGGFQIFTTIDPDLQRMAEQSLRRRLAEVETTPTFEHQTFAQYKSVLADYEAKVAGGAINPATPRPKPEYLQGAALVIDNHDGSILAMVGGRDFGDSEYNRALAGSRPVGTAFTPFVHAAAFSRPDFYPGTPLSDSHLNVSFVMIGATKGILGEWGSESLESSYKMADISAREALVMSRNSATARLGYKIDESVRNERGIPRASNPFEEWTYGVQAVTDVAAKAGIASPLKKDPAMFLGASEAKLDEMCLAYSTFANKGRRPKDLHLIQRVTDAEEKVIFQVSEEETQTSVEAMDPFAAYQTHSCLVEALHRGTGSPSVTDYKLGQFPAAGKTGTHYEFKDLWFLGYTSQVTCGVWAGFDKAKPIYTGAFSNRIALPIWTDIINASQKNYPGKEITPPDGAERVELCRTSGMRATDFCYEKIKDASGEIRSVRSTYEEHLRPGGNFDSYCTVHTGEGLPPGAPKPYDFTGRDLPGSMNPNLVKFANIEPVRMKGLTILGTDPYQSHQPVLRPEIVPADGTTVKRPEIVDQEAATDEPSPIKLKPPAKLIIE